jgi:L-amino acid N-acyltransferase YncA
MTNYTTANTKNDLEGILLLQNANLARGLTREEIQSQGFVTIKHSYDQLKKLNDYEKHIIAKDREKVIGYVLAMTQQSKFDIPIIIPMFNVFSTIMYADKKITDYNFIVVGQVCIDKNYRGQGIFDKCYNEYKKYYKDTYDFAITEIASTNLRSLNAHKRIGFKEIHHYEGSDKTEWVIVLWDWKNGKQLNKQ